MSYPTDLTDQQWSAVSKFIPEAKHGGRPRTTNTRSVINGILYVLKSGCHWRLLPNEYPPWSTTYRYFRAWTKKGVWPKMHNAIYQAVRKSMGKLREPSILIVDSQSVKTGKVAAIKSRGYDGGKRVKGRKRHFVTDQYGLLVETSVTPANVHDTKGAMKALGKFARRQKKKSKDTVLKVYADKGYQGVPFKNWVQKKLGADVRIGENHTQAGGAFVPDKKRWVVERAFAWTVDCYRLQQDRERLLVTSNSMVRLSFIRLMLLRLYPTE